MNYICKSCSGVLENRGYSNRYGILFTCLGCGKKYHGIEKFGRMIITEANKPMFRGGKKAVNIRAYDWQKEKAKRMGGPQKVWDEAIGGPE